MYKIDTGFDPPPPREKNKHITKYPFNAMALGDSFFVPYGADPRRTLKKIETARANYAKRGNHKNLSREFQIHPQPTKNGYRVYKIKER